MSIWASWSPWLLVMLIHQWVRCPEISWALVWGLAISELSGPVVQTLLWQQHPCTAMISLNSPVGPLLTLSSLLSVAASAEVAACNVHQWLTSRLFQDCSLFRKEYCNLRLDKIMMLDTGLGSPADCQVRYNLCSKLGGFRGLELGFDFGLGSVNYLHGENKHH